MNKKTYIIPTMQEVKISTANIIAASPVGGGVNDKPANEGSGGFSRRDRGFWSDEE